MVVTVTVIFGVCYLSDCTIFLLRYHAPKHTTCISDVGKDVNTAMVMLNSAINPIVYVLVNQRFRKKIKAIMCGCACRLSTNRIHHGTADQRMEVANRIIPPILERRATRRDMCRTTNMEIEKEIK